MKKNLCILTLLAIVFMCTTSLTNAQASSTFKVSLGYGSNQKEEVLKLQNFLYSLGYLKVNPTGVFLSLTKKAVADFQLAEGVSPASGYFGPLTRGVANQKTLATNEQPSVQSETRAEVSLKTVTSSTNPFAANAISSQEKTVTWSTKNYPIDAGVNINLVRKISDNPISYSFVRSIYTDSRNDGIENWIPQVGENADDLFVEVTCSNSYLFASGCQFSNSPMKVN